MTTWILFSAPKCICIAASISSKAPRSTKSYLPPVVSSAGVPMTTILPEITSFICARDIAAPNVDAAIQLCPQACATWHLSSPYPGSASYSARNATLGPSPQTSSARNAVGISR